MPSEYLPQKDHGLSLKGTVKSGQGSFDYSSLGSFEGVLVATS